ncbi:fumarylacetoacetate hydrolase FahA [Lentithecium fluviatile CBS 122367]|uniref:Fumarylacetoacetase n=1 Tax=Lentithecium fluviatile CBS 122367 TaxID=1168545 RepID=A0A6G1J2L3_9PLEO|nr:fumarylacetoacetate hydrolase FahA [Lentithecium fluviatile CBS 122367]
MAETYASHFRIDNIPYGIASSSKQLSLQAVTRIGDSVLFLAELSEQKPFSSISQPLPSIFKEKNLNTENIKHVTMHLPAQIGDFADFSVSPDHVQNAPEALFGVRSFPATFHNLPIGYAGRCSSIDTSGKPVTRPLGQYIEDYVATQKEVAFGATRGLDYELEIGAIAGRPVAAGAGVYAKDTDEHIFGLGKEMRDPLGPLNGKNFATSISPWVVTLETLKPFEVPAASHTHPVVDYLRDPNSISYDLTIEAHLTRKGTATTVCKVGFSHVYWTLRQMLAHNSIGGCPLRSGDLLASGTVSGTEKSQYACLMELTMNGRQPFTLDDGSQLQYLEDEDTLRFTAVAGTAGAGAGFGECVGSIKPARNIL